VFNSSLFTPALLRTHSFVFFAVHETRRIFLSLFMSKASRRVFYSFWVSSFHSLTTGHTSAFISRIFLEIGMLWLFHIFCIKAPITWLLFNLVRNSVLQLPSSVIMDPRHGNVSICSSCSLWMSMRHAMPTLAITLVLSTLMSRLYLRLTRSRRSTSSCSFTPKWPTGWCHQRGEGLWLFALRSGHVAVER